MKDTLFDISGEHPKSSPRRKVLTDAPLIEAEFIEGIPRKTIQMPSPILGTIDHTYQCTRPSCGAECSDILDMVGREWLIMCAFCGLMQWVPLIRGFLQPKPAEFRFRDGRFEGLTPAEAAVDPKGSEYLAWAVKSHPRQNVRDAVKTYLDASSVGR